jgi:hypothetical protein
MSTYLQVILYDAESEFHRSDQVAVPATFWQECMKDHVGERPVFVQLGEEGVAARIRPGAETETCQMPEWLWIRIGAPEWTSIQTIEVPDAGRITLRARKEASLTGVPDAVGMLAAALSGSGGPSWAVLTVGSELPLACGVFDIMGLESCENFPVSSACILNMDLDLELVPALDHVEPVPEPAPAPAAPAPPAKTVSRFAKKFEPFAGVGRRLGDP